MSCSKKGFLGNLHFVIIHHSFFIDLLTSHECDTSRNLANFCVINNGYYMTESSKGFLCSLHFCLKQSLLPGSINWLVINVTHLET